MRSIKVVKEDPPGVICQYPIQAVLDRERLAAGTRALSNRVVEMEAFAFQTFREVQRRTFEVPRSAHIHQHPHSSRFEDTVASVFDGIPTQVVRQSGTAARFHCDAEILLIEGTPFVPGRCE